MYKAYKNNNILDKIDAAVPKEGVISDVYQWSAFFGKIVATISLIFACIVGFLLFVFGIYVIRYPDSSNKPTDNSNPNDKDRRSNNVRSGIFMIIISILIVVSASIYYYLVYTYKAVAAIAGVNGIFDGIDMIS